MGSIVNNKTPQGIVGYIIHDALWCWPCGTRHTVFRWCLCLDNYENYYGLTSTQTKRYHHGLV